MKSERKDSKKNDVRILMKSQITVTKKKKNYIISSTIINSECLIYIICFNVSIQNIY